MYKVSRMRRDDKQQDAGGERLKNRNCKGIKFKARFGQNTEIHK